MRKISIYLLSIFLLFSCKEKLASEQELKEKIIGIWEVKEVEIYENGEISHSKIDKNTYWNFNAYGDLVIHDQKKIVFVANVIFWIYNYRKGSGTELERLIPKDSVLSYSESKILKRKIGDVVLQYPFKRGDFIINRIPCFSSEIEGLPRLLAVKTHTATELVLEIRCCCSNERIITIKLKRAKDQGIAQKIFEIKNSQDSVQEERDSISTPQSEDRLVPVESLIEENIEVKENLYRNKTYKFRLRFPENWKNIEGDAQHTIAKFVQKDSGKSISIVAVPYKENDESNFADKIPPFILKEKFESYMRKMNIEFSSINIENGYVNNFPANILFWKQVAKSGTREIDYIQKSYNWSKAGIAYNITIAMPKAFYTDKEIRRMERVIESFVFEDDLY